MSGLRLKCLSYSERKGDPDAWSIEDLSLHDVNLIVGRNASGKTRTLNVIWNLARHFVEPAYRVLHGFADATFDHDGTTYQFRFVLRDGKIAEEQVIVDGDVKLDRTSDGIVTIFAQGENRKLRFHPPETQLAAVLRRDSLQHPFLEPLHDWATRTRHFSFGGSLGRNIVSVEIAPQEGQVNVDDRDTMQVLGIFQVGQNRFGSDFVESVIRDMKRLDYDLDRIEIVPPSSLQVMKDGVPRTAKVLGLREPGVAEIVEQRDVSQGMFRVLSLLIQVNYSQLARSSDCILIDDIGEGLDFERSTELVHLLRDKARESKFQLVMTTNDRFVMNGVPLEEWSVLQRTGSHVRVRNYENSKDRFDEFRFTGLSNFDLLRYDFLSDEPAEEVAAGTPD